MDRRDEVFINFVELRPLTPETAHETKAPRKERERELRAIPAGGGAFVAPDIGVAAMALIAMLTGVTTWRREGGRPPDDAIEDLHAALALRAVGASAPVAAAPA